MKIVPHKYHKDMYILHDDENHYLGAGISHGIGDTRIVWYSHTAKVADDIAFATIREWVLSLGGKTMGGGMCTSNQGWNEWSIPIPLEELLSKYLLTTPKE